MAITLAISPYLAICGHKIFHIHLYNIVNNESIKTGNNINLSHVWGYMTCHKYIGNNISQYKEL